MNFNISYENLRAIEVSFIPYYRGLSQQEFAELFRGTVPGWTLIDNRFYFSLKHLEQPTFLTIRELVEKVSGQVDAVVGRYLEHLRLHRVGDERAKG